MYKRGDLNKKLEEGRKGVDLKASLTLYHLLESLLSDYLKLKQTELSNVDSELEILLGMRVKQNATLVKAKDEIDSILQSEATPRKT
jgi:hypothetical protein